MESKPIKYGKLKIAVNDTTWTPIAHPGYGFDYFSMRNMSDGNVLIRTDPDDPNTEDVLVPNAAESCTTFTTRHVWPYFRFEAGEAIFHAKTVSGPGVVMLTVAS